MGAIFSFVQLFCVLLQSAVQTRIPAGIDMNVNILTSGYWPTYPVVDAKLPAELNAYQQVQKWRVGPTFAKQSSAAADSCVSSLKWCR